VQVKIVLLSSKNILYAVWALKNKLGVYQKKQHYVHMLSL